MVLFVTRLWRLDAPSLWEDDYLNLDRAMMPLADMFAVQKHQGPADTIFDFQPPLFYALEHLALAVDQSSLAARLLSVLAGLVTPFGLLLLGRRILGRGVGPVAFALSVFLLYPINFAQSIKFYAVFLCLAVFSLWLLVRAVEDNARRLWFGYGLCALGMLYAGYQGFPTFAAQLAWATVACHRRSRTETPRVRSLRWFRFLLTGGLVFAAYLPWLPAAFFLGEFLRAPSMAPLEGLDGPFALKVLRGFVSPDPNVSPAYILGWWGLAGCGLWAGLRDRRGEGLLLLGLAAAAGTLSLLCSKTLLRPNLESRHFIMLFPALVLLVARGVVFLGNLTAGAMSRFRGGRFVGGAAAGLACLGLLWPSLAGYHGYYHRTMSLDREFFQWLDGALGDVDALEFHGYKRNTRRFAARWYLPDRFGEAGTFDRPGYRRMADIDTAYRDAAAARPAWPGQVVKAFDALFATTRVSVFGAANRSPVVMDPGPDGVFRYADDFRSRRFYEDAARSENMTLDAEIGMLRPARYSRPALAVWVFETPPGQSARDLRLDVAAALYKKHPDLPADATLTVEAGPDGETYTTVAVIGQEAFPERDGRPVEERRDFFDEIGFYDGRCRIIRTGFDVDPALASDRLFVRISYRPGHVEGFLNLAGLGLTAALNPSDPAASPEKSPLAVQAGHLLENVGAVRWREDDRETLGRFAFAAPGNASLCAANPLLGTPEDLSRFRERHFGLDPVHTLADVSGRPAVFLYDPGLATPGVALSDRLPRRRLAGLPAFGHGPASLRLTGTILSPVLRIGEQTLSLPVIAPAGSSLTLTPGGRGRLRFVPDWTGPERFAPSVSYARDVIPSSRLRGELTCQPGEGGCAFAYSVVTGLPITELRLKVFPQVYANPCRKCPGNEARVAVSTDDGRTWQRLVRETGGEACSWTSPAAYVTQRLAFEKPVTSLRLAFELEKGGEAGFLSPSWNVDGMYIEADLDASVLPPLRPAGPDLDVTLDGPAGNDISLVLRPGPWPLSDRIYEP